MDKPPKPYPEFPLFPHQSGQWAKKINGSIRYFGTWDDPDKAFTLYESEKKAWELNINPRTMTILPSLGNKNDLNIDDGINLFLDDVDARVNRGELSRRSYNDYKHSCQRVVKAVPRTFPINAMTTQQWAKVEKHLRDGLNPTTAGNHINRVLICFKWLRDNRLIQEPYYGTAMKRPSKSKIRIARNQGGKRWFDRDEIHSLLAGARPSIAAMIMLGVNCGYGNADCSRLQTSWIQFDTGWINFARPKTGVDRRAKLWPETLQYINAWLDVRPKVNVPWLFITRQGNQWSLEDDQDCQIAKTFRDLCKSVKLHVKGRGFYGLRRTCETIGGNAKDQVALDYIMGHIDQTMGGVYRQRIEDHRLEAVSEVIRSWLFGVVPGAGTDNAADVQEDPRNDKGRVPENGQDKPKKSI